MEESLVRIGLFVHIASATGLVAALAVELLSGHLVTRAEDASQVRIMAKGAELGGRLGALSLVGLLLSGPDLASRMTFFEGDGVQGWIAVAIAVIVVVGGAGAMIHRRAFRTLGLAAAADGDQDVNLEMRALMVKPLPWISMHASVGLVLAAVWLMSNKPLGVIDALTPAALGLALGAGAGFVVARMTAARLA